MKNQLVVAVRSTALSDVLARTGFHPFEDGTLFTLLARAGLWLGPRYLLEEDESFRQIIPYVVLRYSDMIACYRRTVAGGEGRLHGKASIGFGGHLEAGDVVYADQSIDVRATIETGAAREVREEVGHVRVVSQRWSGLLVENDSAVGRVHVGVVGEWTVADAEIAGAEDAVATVRFTRLAQLLANYGNLESWSSMVASTLTWAATESRSEAVDARTSSAVSADSK